MKKTLISFRIILIILILFEFTFLAESFVTQDDSYLTELTYTMYEKDFAQSNECILSTIEVLDFNDNLNSRYYYDDCDIKSNSVCHGEKGRYVYIENKFDIFIKGNFCNKIQNSDDENILIRIYFGKISMASSYIQILKFDNGKAVYGESFITLPKFLFIHLSTIAFLICSFIYSFFKINKFIFVLISLIVSYIFTCYTVHIKDVIMFKNYNETYIITKY